MPDRRLLGPLLLAVAVAAPLPGAEAATRKPTITAVTPSRATIGQPLTISGRGFNRGVARNTVIFARTGAPLVFVRAGRSTSTRIAVTLPAKLAPTLPQRGGRAVPARYRVRVLARRLSDPTALRRSPVLGPAARSAPTTPPTRPTSPTTPKPTPSCFELPPATDPVSDFDRDTLPDSLEKQIGTDRCLRDTDLDGVEDGFEYRSALDLNRGNAAVSVPYPGKRPYPNALDPSDAGTDYDGDSLTEAEEFRAWTDPRYGNRALPLNYSDGRQATQPAPVPDPARKADPGAIYAQDASLRFLDVDGDRAVSALELDALDADRDDVVSDREYRFQDGDGDGVLGDDEKDLDGDGAGNADEAHVRLHPGHWAGVYKEEPRYPISFAQPDWLTPDSDGDGIVDGLDDQDFDGWTNLAELSRGAAQSPALRRADDPAVPVQSAYGQVNPYNPCLPARSRPMLDLATGSPTVQLSPTCMRYPPLDSPPAPFDEGSPKYPGYLVRQ